MQCGNGRHATGKGPTGCCTIHSPSCNQLRSPSGVPVPSLTRLGGDMKAFNHENDPLIFQFRIRFDPSASPLAAKELFQEEMRAWFIQYGFDYGFGALGGCTLIYGDVGRNGADVTLDDRAELAEWLKRQR